MSLAITAAPFDSDNDTNDTNFNCNDTAINKKRQSSTHTHTKTQKKTPTTDFNSEKVMSVLQSIHNNTTDNDLGDFNPKKNHGLANNTNHVVLNPLEPSVLKEGMTNINSSVPLPLDNDDMDLQELQSAFLNDAQVRDYYKKLIPGHNTVTTKHNVSNKSSYPQKNINEHVMSSSSNEDLLNKLNYMINLLEDQQDERTNNVTEEVVLYSFLGIFIIFVVDSFARVGKYTR
jgi:hypothetical protein